MLNEGNFGSRHRVILKSSRIRDNRPQGRVPRVDVSSGSRHVVVELSTETISLSSEFQPLLEPVQPTRIALEKLQIPGRPDPNVWQVKQVVGDEVAAARHTETSKQVLGTEHAKHQPPNERNRNKLPHDSKGLKRFPRRILFLAFTFPNRVREIQSLPASRFRLRERHALDAPREAHQPEIKKPVKPPWNEEAHLDLLLRGHNGNKAVLVKETNAVHPICLDMN